MKTSKSTLGGAKGLFAIVWKGRCKGCVRCPGARVLIDTELTMFVTSCWRSSGAGCRARAILMLQVEVVEV